MYIMILSSQIFSNFTWKSKKEKQLWLLKSGYSFLKSNYVLVLIFVLLSRTYFSISIIYILIFKKNMESILLNELSYYRS